LRRPAATERIDLVVGTADVGTPVPELIIDDGKSIVRQARATFPISNVSNLKGESFISRRCTTLILQHAQQINLVSMSFFARGKKSDVPCARFAENPFEDINETALSMRIDLEKKTVNQPDALPGTANDSNETF